MSRAQLTSTDQQNSGGPVSPFVAGKNKIINGDFGIWQRGTSFSTSGNYTSDRWIVDSDATFTASQQTFTPGSAPVSGYEGTYYLQIAKSSGGSYVDAKQRLEDVRVLAGQTVTLSAWIQVSSGTASVQPYYNQYFGTGGSSGVAATVTAQTVGTTWTRYSWTFVLPSISGKTIGTNSFTEIYLPRIVTSSAVTVSIWGVQLEAGSVATPFTTASGTVQGELALCQRYYEKRTVGGANYGTGINGLCLSSYFASTSVTFATPKRVNPSASFGGNLNILGSSINQAVTSVSGVFGAGNSTSGYIGGDLNVSAASGLVTNSAIWLRDNGAGTAYIEFSAEL